MITPGSSTPSLPRPLLGLEAVLLFVMPLLSRAGKRRADLGVADSGLAACPLLPTALWGSGRSACYAVF